MDYLVGSGTNVGIKKTINEDSYMIKLAKTPHCKLAMCLICDGMGGLSKGEVASAYVIDEFSKWFHNQLPLIINERDIFNIIKKQWEDMLIDLNDRLNKYGSEHCCNLGSTITGAIIINNKYLAVNVGDSRTYKLSDNIYQITEDQSFVAYEIKMGRMTKEQGDIDPRKNVLLQCIGAVPNIEVLMYEGELLNGEALLLCSDGFRHVVTEKEIYEKLCPSKNNSNEDINNRINELIQLNMDRMENDNITAIMIKSIKED